MRVANEMTPIHIQYVSVYAPNSVVHFTKANLGGWDVFDRNMPEYKEIALISFECHCARNMTSGLW